jgi:flagellar M-ring protein FliF
MKSLASSLLALWRELGLNQRVSLAVAALAVLGGLAALVLWSRQPDYQLLYGRLAEKDSSQIIAQLQAQNIPHRLANGGAAIMVPAEHVHRLRMDFATKGVPSGEGVGFEIFDKTQFGLSDFVQRTNYLRALQGELSRTIAQLDGVTGARVMIVQPENRLLVTSQGVKSTASVFVELSRARLEPEAVDSIRHLVANSVQGLSADDVAVVDHRGRVLSEDLRADPTLAGASSQMRYRQQIEDYLAKKVESLLLPVVGAGGAVVRVSAEIENETTSRTEERYDPDVQVVRSQTSTEDTTRSAEERPAPTAVGTTANIPADAAVDATTAATVAATGPANLSESARKNRTIAYELNRTLTTTARQPGAIRRLSAAVFVAQRMATPTAATPGAVATPTPQPRTTEELQALRQIVVNALGLIATPELPLESLVSVQEMPFAAVTPAETIATLERTTNLQSWVETLRPYLALIAAGVLLIFFVKLLNRQRPEPIPVEILTAASADPALAAAHRLPLTPEALTQLIQQKPANVGTALREWSAKK